MNNLFGKLEKFASKITKNDENDNFTDFLN